MAICEKMKLQKTKNEAFAEFKYLENGQLYSTLNIITEAHNWNV